MNFENNVTSDPHRTLLNLSNKTVLTWIDKYVALSNLIIYYTWKYVKNSHTKTKKLKYQVQSGMRNLNYLIDSVLY